MFQLAEHDGMVDHLTFFDAILLSPCACHALEVLAPSAALNHLELWTWYPGRCGSRLNLDPALLL